MKDFYFFIILMLPFIGFTQKKTNSDLATNTNSRISFVAGIGTSFTSETLYKDPTINQTNNFVIIEEADKQKTSLTLGIVYTPYLYKISYDNGAEEYISKGISFSTFFNPISLSKVYSSQSYFNIIDFGIGLGWKFAGGVMVMGTVEWFGARQPKDWFVQEYKGNNKSYVINNDIQHGIDITNSNIFDNKLITNFGIKVCYTFDIIKNFYNTSQDTEEKLFQSKAGKPTHQSNDDLSPIK